MSQKLLPLRFSILKLLSNRISGLTPHEVYQELKDKYPNEKQCQPNTIDEHLMSMKGVGLVEQKSADFDEKEQVVITYAITEYGKSKVVQYIN